MQNDVWGLIASVLMNFVSTDVRRKQHRHYNNEKETFHF